MEKNNFLKNIKFAIPLKNYIILAIGFVVIILGYVLMIGEASNVNPEVFNYDIFSFRRIVLAPIVILIGFGIEIFGILWNSDKNKKQETE